MRHQTYNSLLFQSSSSFLSSSFVCYRAAELFVYRLKQLEKIDQEDIIGIMEEFEKLDKDESGTLTIDDLAQKTT